MKKIKKNSFVLMFFVGIAFYFLFKYKLNFFLPKFVSNQSPYLHCSFRPFEDLVNSQDEETSSLCPFAKDSSFQFNHDEFLPFLSDLIKKYYSDYTLEFANILDDEFDSDASSLFKLNAFDRILAANQKTIVVWPCRSQSPMHAMGQNTMMFVICGAKITPDTFKNNTMNRTAFFWAGIAEKDDPVKSEKRLYTIEQPLEKGLFLADILIYNTRLALQVDKAQDFGTKIWKKESTLYAYDQEKFYPLLTYPSLIDETQLDVCKDSQSSLCSLREFELSLQFKVSKQSMDAYLIEKRSVNGKQAVVKNYYPIAFNENQWSYRYTHIQPDLSFPVNRYE